MNACGKFVAFYAAHALARHFHPIFYSTCHRFWFVPKCSQLLTEHHLHFNDYLWVNNANNIKNIDVSFWIERKKKNEHMWPRFLSTFQHNLCVHDFFFVCFDPIYKFVRLVGFKSPDFHHFPHKNCNDNIFYFMIGRLPTTQIPSSSSFQSIFN